MHQITQISAISADEMAYSMLSNITALMNEARINVLISDIWLVVCIVLAIVLTVCIVKHFKSKRKLMAEQNRLLKEMKDVIVNGATANADKLATIASSMKPA